MGWLEKRGDTLRSFKRRFAIIASGKILHWAHPKPAPSLTADLDTDAFTTKEIVTTLRTRGFQFRQITVLTNGKFLGEGRGLQLQLQESRKTWELRVEDSSIRLSLERALAVGAQ